MKLTGDEAQVDNIGDCGNKKGWTFFKKPGEDRLDFDTPLVLFHNHCSLPVPIRGYRLHRESKNKTLNSCP